MKKSIIVLFFIIFLTLTSCSRVSVTPLPDPPGYTSTEHVSTPEATEQFEQTTETFLESNETLFETVPEIIPDTNIEDDQTAEISTENNEPVTEPQTEQVPLPPPEYAGSIALTFDDGPGIYTDRLLDILKRNDAKATFFVVGNRISYQKDKLKIMADEGHEIGNHTFSHISLKTLDYPEIYDQILSAKNAIEAVTGIENKLVRAPYGDLSTDVYNVGKTLNVSFIHWSLDTLDWMSRDPQKVYEDLMSRVTDGDIILLHDIHESTVDAMEMVIPDLITNGYKLVTVSELLTEDNTDIIPGGVYVRK